jgi:multicomponent Na+:H+ antiporter subunit B
MTEFFTLPFKLEFYSNNLLLYLSIFIVVLASVGLVIARNSLESIVIMSIFSVFISISYLLMDAPDVAMTETALGACLSTCVLLNIVKICGEDIGDIKRVRVFYALILCGLFVIILTWASQDLPEFGRSDSPIQTHISKYYIQNTASDIGVPSLVAGILASYRGYDTLGETSVILIAGMAVMIILSRRKPE